MLSSIDPISCDTGSGNVQKTMSRKRGDNKNKIVGERTISSTTRSFSLSEREKPSFSFELSRADGRELDLFLLGGVP